MNKMSWGYMIIGAIGMINIVLSILNAMAVALSLKAINYVIIFIVPFLAIEVSLTTISDIIPKLSFFLRNILSPLTGWSVSIVLLLSGIGIILRKSWGISLIYIYIISIIFLSMVGITISIPKYLILYYSPKGPFDPGIALVGALIHIIVFISTLLYPILLLIFFSRPRVKEMFGSKRWI